MCARPNSLSGKNLIANVWQFGHAWFGVNIVGSKSVKSPIINDFVIREITYHLRADDSTIFTHPKPNPLIWNFSIHSAQSSNNFIIPQLHERYNILYCTYWQ